MADVLLYMAGHVALLAGAVVAGGALERSQAKVVPDVLQYVRDFHRHLNVVAESALVELLVAPCNFVVLVDSRVVFLQLVVLERQGFECASAFNLGASHG